MLTPVHQCRHATGIHERQARQINDDLPFRGRDRGKRGGDTYRVCYVKHPAQHDDNLAIAFTDTHMHEGHSHAFPLQQQRRSPDSAAEGGAGLEQDGDAGMVLQDGTEPVRERGDLLGPGASGVCLAVDLGEYGVEDEAVKLFLAPDVTV